jgi:DNA-binding CsgD family transcriptional regulator
MLDKQFTARSDDQLALDWHGGALTVPAEGFQAWVLSGDDGDDGLHLHGLDGDTRAAFPLIRRLEPWWRNMEAQPGRVACWVHDERWAGAQGHPAWEAVVQRHGMAHAMAVAAPATGGGTQAVMLARGASGAAFGPDEQQCFERLVGHAVVALSTCQVLNDAWAAVRGGRSLAWQTAIVQANGTLRDESAGFAGTVRREWPDWTSGPLPLVLSPSRTPGGVVNHLGGTIAVRMAPAHGGCLLAVRPRYASDVLSERERHVATQYAAGATYRDIATALHLSPATVRAHLRNVFAKLGVNSKVKMAALLR